MQEQCPVSCKEDSCKDGHVRCPVWAKLKDECEENPDMRKSCRKSCNFCDQQEEEEEAAGIEEDGEPCVDNHEKCKYWADKGEW
jgi:hypothetical protein